MYYVYCVVSIANDRRRERFLPPEGAAVPNDCYLSGTSSAR